MIQLIPMIWRITLCLVLINSTLPFGSATTTSIANLLQTGVSATEETTYDPFRFLILCSPGSPVRNTCEKCTKVTRDPNTYKMCCENSNGVQKWCRTFLDYTLPPRLVSH